MKKLVVSMGIMLLAGANLTAGSPPVTQGTITYTIERKSMLNINGTEVPQTMDIVSDVRFKAIAYQMTDMVKIRGGGGPPGSENGFRVMRYYDASDKQVYSIQNARGMKFALKGSDVFTDFKETGQSETKLGYACKSFSGILNGKQAQGWYTTELPSGISPAGNLGVPGTILEMQSENMTFKATAVKPGEAVSDDELKMPSDADKVTREQMMQKLRGGK